MLLDNVHWHKYDVKPFNYFVFVYLLGESLSMMCIGNCMGSLRMLGGNFTCLGVVEVGGGWSAQLVSGS